jgi:ATP-dependent helicase/nuclease subunit B
MHPLISAAPACPDAFCWQQAMAGLKKALHDRHVHPADAVVLLPYAQLMQQARKAWAAHGAGAQDGQHAEMAVFVPRFETTMNWASSLGGRLGLFVPTGTDLQMDVAVDTLTAASLLHKASLGNQQDVLAGRLVEAAWSLARVAAAVPPGDRVAWGERLAPLLSADLESPALAREAALGRIALAWAATSSYPTDRLFEARPEFLAVLEGFQQEPLGTALQVCSADAAVSIALDAAVAGDTPSPLPAMHQALDAEDEAGRAAACVLAHLAQGRSPVALIAQDRLLTRRVGAMLGERGVAMRDETGWKLSTTRAAATLMGLLRAMPWDAPADAVLDWLKNAVSAPGFAPAAVDAAETELRQYGVRLWRDLPQVPVPALERAQLVARAVDAVRSALARARPLPVWLRDLRSALQASGQWDALALDGAGQVVQSVLRLHEGAGAEFKSAPTMTLAAFTSWVNQALEAGTFTPAQPNEAQVVILPLAQLLGRPMQAVVLPGCDEIRLPVSPEPSGPWTPAQRELLGLPSRQSLAKAQRQAWAYALRHAHVDVLWRASEAGERLVPSGFVQEILLDHVITFAPDPRLPRAVPARPTPRPLPSGDALPVTRLSASAYEDLRSCPYRFFALRQLRLQAPDELESELGKRDFGNWLHSLLKIFHDMLKTAAAQDKPARVAMINVAAERATQELALSESEFLPFAAIWPRVREGYLAWLAEHEATGAVFDVGEASLSMPLGRLTLIGKIDRMDRQSDGHALLIDYKTESRSTTAERIKSGQEDTQLAFYAALIEDDTLAAAYVNLGEKEPTKTYAQPDIVGLRDELIEGIRDDMARLEQGAALPALGEGKACDYCAARGLCRKDFWK